MTGTLWFALLGGHLAWSLHLVASYYIAYRACVAGADAPTELWALLHAATIVAAVVTLGSILVSSRHNSQESGRGAANGAERTPDGQSAPGRLGPQRSFLAGVTLPLNVMFLFAILAAGVLNFLIVPCA